MTRLLPSLQREIIAVDKLIKIPYEDAYLFPAGCFLNGDSLSFDLQIRIETDPADRTQLRMTIASGDPTLTFEYVF